MPLKAILHESCGCYVYITSAKCSFSKSKLNLKKLQFVAMCMEINVIEIEYVNSSPLRRQNRPFFGKRGLLEGILCTKSNGLENVSMWDKEQRQQQKERFLQTILFNYCRSVQNQPTYQQVFVPCKPFDGYSRTIQEGVCFILFWQTFPFLAKSFTTLQLKIERLCTFLYAR